jgi:hypothetical protein
MHRSISHSKMEITASSSVSTAMYHTEVQDYEVPHWDGSAAQFVAASCGFDDGYELIGQQSNEGYAVSQKRSLI